MRREGRKISYQGASITLVSLILFRMGLFGAAHGLGGEGAKSLSSLISVTHISKFYYIKKYRYRLHLIHNF